MASQSHKLHFILFPFMAPGHMIPMMDIGRMLAQQGMMVTIITTPLNAKRFEATVARAADSGLQIKLIQVPFPSEEAGLPTKCENLDMMSSLGLAKGFFHATSMLQESVERLFEQLSPRPSCLVSDMLLPYTAAVATKFRVPRISFNGCSALFMLCLHKLEIHNVLERINSDSEPFVVPGLPDRIELTKKQLPHAMIDDNASFGEKIWAAEAVNCGFIINTFDELEPAYVEEFKKTRENRVWCIGPVSLLNKDFLDRIQRGNKASIDESLCLEWLNLHEPGSVIYVCLGSICNLITPQLIELAMALEESNRPFIWVVRGGETAQGLEKWVAEDGFEERTRGRGLLIRGWAPQIVILSHPAIGGFLTHCGWNSILEGVSGGKPMVTWPLFGDQFCNEKLVVEVLKIGVSVGSEATIKWGKEEKIGVLVKKESVRKAINELMESEERRKRVKQLSEMAKKAMTEEGSSYLNMRLLIENINQQPC